VVGTRYFGDVAVDTQPALPALAALSQAAARLAEESSLDDALEAVAELAAQAAGADLALVRVVEGDSLVVRAVAAPPSLAAAVAGSRVPVDELPAEERDDESELPAAVAGAARRAGAAAAVVLPVRLGGLPAASLELYRLRDAFTAAERDSARAARAQLGLVLRALGRPGGSDGVGALPALETATEALAAASGDAATAVRVARFAAEATGARSAAVWRLADGETAEQVAAAGEAAPAEAGELAATLLRSREAASVERAPSSGAAVVTLQLGRAEPSALQLVFDEGAAPAASEMAALAAFAAAAGRAIRAAEHAEQVRGDLERTRALLAVVGQAISTLSLAHTLETAVERVADLLGVDAVAVYLRREQRLAAAAYRGLSGPHTGVAEHLLRLALGRFRARGAVAVRLPRDHRMLAPVRLALEEARIEAAHAVPLVVQDEVIGLLAIYPPHGRELTDDDTALLKALAGQLAVAVQNAQLHEQATRLGRERERALQSERRAARRLSALYEISRSFTQSLSLEATLDAVARTVVELLEVDAAVLRMRDERGDALLAEALHVARPELEPAVRTAFFGPQGIAHSPFSRLLRGRPLRLDVATAEAVGGSHALLVPFIEKGSTALVVPIATPAEVLATLTLISFDPGRPLTDETAETALSVAAPAALAIDNARLYDQQKRFMDTMQRSLLPRDRPDLEGVEVGEAYESSARLDVGGDLYDYLLIGGQLAVVLGDVTGHGIDAAADMAMAKFVFRSLAREHPEPADFLAHANEVVVEEIASGKFITMLYLALDPRAGVVTCGSAGHPPPRVVPPDGAVRSLDARGLALGIVEGQSYEEVRATVEPGTSFVLYTDGVVEARRGDELYGEARLDGLLADRRHLPPRELAAAVLEDCRAFAGGELTDDCAVVVVRLGR